MPRKTKVPVTPSGGSTPPPGGTKPGETEELDVQGSAVHGFRQDDALKRIIKQHPQKGIPQVEGIEPQDAPPKE